jgi:hypothetical protein
MHRACPGLLALTILLCSACAPEVPSPPASKPAVAAIAAAQEPAPAPPPAPKLAAPPADMLGWWNRPEVLASLGLTAAEGAAMTLELDHMERSYQTAQRQLPTVKHTQMQMLQDPKVPSADIRRFNRQNLQWLRTSMADQNIAARLWVREHLSADQLERLLQHSPRFFGMRWFRAAGDPGQTE